MPVTEGGLPSFRRSLEQAAQEEQLRQQVASQNERIQPEDVEVERRDGRIEANVPEQVQRRVAAEQIDEELDLIDVEASDVERQDGQFRPTEETRRRFAAEDIDRQLSAVNVSPGDLQETEQGFVPSEEVQRRQAAAEIGEQFDRVDISPDDIERADDGFRVSEDVQRQEAAAQLDRQLDRVEIGPQDIERADDGFRPTEEVQRRQAARTIDEQIDAAEIDTGDIVEEGGEFRVREDVQRGLAVEQLQEETPFDVTREDIVAEGDQFRIAEETQRQQAAQAIDEQVEEAEITTSDIRQTESGGFALREGRQREIAAGTIAEQTEGIDAGDISGQDIELGDGQASLTEDAQTRLAIEDLDERTTTRLDRDDVLVEDGSVQLAPEVAEREAAFNLSRANTTPKQFVAGELQAPETATRIEPGQDVVATETDDGLAVQVAREFQRGQFVDAANEQVSFDVDRQDVEFDAEQGQFQIKESAQATAIREQGVEIVEERTGVEVDQQDIDPDLERGGFELTEDAQRDIAAQRLQENTAADLRRGEDFSIRIRDEETREAVSIDTPPGLPDVDVGKFAVDLEASGRRKLTIAKAEEEGELGERTITDAEEQIEFDEEGQVESVGAPPTEGSEGVIGAVGGAKDFVVNKVSVVTDPVLSVASSGEEAVFREGRSGDVFGFIGEGVDTGTDIVAMTPVGQGVQFGGSVLAGQVGRSAAVVQASSQGAADFVIEEGVKPGAGNLALTSTGLGPGAAVTGQEVNPNVLPTEQTEPLLTGAGTATTEFTVGLPAKGVEIGRTGKQTTEFTAQQIGEEGVVAGLGTSAAVGGAVVSETGVETTREAFANPAQTTGQVFASAAIGTAFSPVRVSKLKVPRSTAGTTIPRVSRPSIDVELPSVSAGVSRGDISVSRPRLERPEGTRVPRVTRPDVEVESPRLDVDVDQGEFSLTRPRLERPDTTTLRAVRITEPLIFRGRVDTPGVTVAGFKGLRPTKGAPTVNPATVDFTRLGGRGATAEPVGRFETDVFREMAAEAGPGSLRRFEAAERIAKMGSRTDPELEVTKTEDIVKLAEDVPDEAAADIAKGLEEIDATIFGSAAVRAQEPTARTPRDVDIVVDDKSEATRVLDEALEGTGKETSDVFDIKTTGEKAQPGEIVKLGRIAQQRLETEEGVKVTPIGEELIKKSGASAFIRGPGSPASEFPGSTKSVDVGPEPVAPGSLVRVKDPGDAATIGAGISEATSSLRPFKARGRAKAVAEFQEAFEPEIQRSLAEPTPVSRPKPIISREEFERFVADEAAEFRPRRSQSDIEPSLETDESGPLRSQRPREDVDSPSSTTRTGFDKPLPVSSSGGGTADFDNPAIGSGVEIAEVDTPSPVADEFESSFQTSPTSQPQQSAFGSAPTQSPVSSPGSVTDVGVSDIPASGVDAASQVGGQSQTSTAGVSSPGSPITAAAVSVATDTAIAGIRRRESDQSDFLLETESRFAKEFEEDIAAPETVLNFEGPAGEDMDLVEGERRERTVEPLSSEIVTTEGDIPSDLEDDLGL